jgi:hypothetical protein
VSKAIAAVVHCAASARNLGLCDQGNLNLLRLGLQVLSAASPWLLAAEERQPKVDG